MKYLRTLHPYCSVGVRALVDRLLDPTCSRREKKGIVKEAQRVLRRESWLLQRLCKTITACPCNDRLARVIGQHAIHHLEMMTELRGAVKNLLAGQVAGQMGSVGNAVQTVLDHAASPSLAKLAGLNPNVACRTSDAGVVPWACLVELTSALEGLEGDHVAVETCWAELGVHGRKALLDAARSCRAATEVEALVHRIEEYLAWPLTPVHDAITRKLTEAVQYVAETIKTSSTFALLDAVRRMMPPGGFTVAAQQTDAGDADERPRACQKDLASPRRREGHRG